MRNWRRLGHDFDPGHVSRATAGSICTSGYGSRRYMAGEYNSNNSGTQQIKSGNFLKFLQKTKGWRFECGLYQACFSSRGERSWRQQRANCAIRTRSCASNQGRALLVAPGHRGANRPATDHYACRKKRRIAVGHSRHSNTGIVRVDNDLSANKPC